MHLRKANFDASRRSLTFVRLKTDSLTQFSDLPDVAVRVLTEAAAFSNTEFIFAMDFSDATFRAVIKQACSDAGITYGRGLIDGVTFHSTRHSFTTRLVQVADIATTASLTGHSDKEMVAYYAHASDASRRAAWRSLYGGELDAENLRDLFERVRSGECNFEQFERELQGEKAAAKSA